MIRRGHVVQELESLKNKKNDDYALVAHQVGQCIVVPFRQSDGTNGTLFSQRVYFFVCALNGIHTRPPSGCFTLR